MSFHAGSLYLFIISACVYVGHSTFQTGFKAFKWSIGGGRHRAYYSATVYPWERETDIYSRERLRARVYTTSVKLANFLLSKKNQRAAQQIY